MVQLPLLSQLLSISMESKEEVWNLINTLENQTFRMREADPQGLSQPVTRHCQNDLLVR